MEVQEPEAPPTEPAPASPPEEDDRPDVEPRQEPAEEPSDPHTPPLDDDEDATHLQPDDSRRLAAEERLARRPEVA